MCCCFEQSTFDGVISNQVAIGHSDNIDTSISCLREPLSISSMKVRVAYHSDMNLALATTVIPQLHW